MTQEFWIVLIAATMAGTLGSLIGAGGGFLLMPFLLFLYPNAPHANLTLFSLIFVFVNSLIASIGYQKSGRISWKLVGMLTVGAIPGAWMGAVWNQSIPREMFQKIFGALLLLVAILVFWKSLGKKPTSKETLESQSQPEPPSVRKFFPAKWILLGLVVGVLSSFSGVGGGILQVPVMIYLFHLPLLISTATSQATIVISSAVGIFKHVMLLQQNGNLLSMATFFPSGDMDPLQVIALVIGALLGAPMGVFFSSRINPKWISILMATLIFFSAVRLLS